MLGLYNRVTELDSTEQRRMINELWHGFPYQPRGYPAGAASSLYSKTLLLCCSITRRLQHG
eukprot:1366516-Amphidinium_carterae.1